MNRTNEREIDRFPYTLAIAEEKEEKQGDSI